MTYTSSTCELKSVSLIETQHNIFCVDLKLDKTWIHHYTPETKEHSKQWNAKGESAPNNAKTVSSVEKVMVNWDNMALFAKKGRI